MRILVLLVLASALGGCTNMVFSSEPLFPHDSAAAASIRTGVWESSECQQEFDRRSLVQHWPPCAGGGLVRRRDFSGAHVLAAGDPMIQQSRFGAEVDGPVYTYRAVRALKHDARGRIIALELWVVECGPRDPNSESGLTKSPHPGLTLSGDNCFATDPGTVRGAALASRKWAKVSTWTWVRRRELFDKEWSFLTDGAGPGLFRKKEAPPAAPAADRL